MPLKAILRPWVGLVALQPLTLIWCYIHGIDYLGNLGIFSIICTIFLMPVYELYERLYPKSLSISDTTEDT
jgi:hypothetical protein